MARKRLVSPAFFTHAELFEAEASSGFPLRVAFAGLWTQADRRGSFAWKPRELKLAILPYDAGDFAEVLDALERFGFVRSFAVAGKRYGLIESFAAHQTFHPGEKHDRTIPDAPEALRAVPEDNLGTPQQVYEDNLGHPRQVSTPLLASGHALSKHSVTVTVTDISAITSTMTVGEVSSAPTATEPTVERSNGVRKTGIQKLTPAEHRQLDEKFGGERHPPAFAVPPSVYAEQEAELRAAALPHEAMALDALLRTHRQPDALILELYSFASGMKVCRGETTGRNADVTDVMRAVAEMAANGAEWSVRLFRGYLRRVADQKPEPATLEDRTAARLASEIRRHTPAEPTRGERNDAGAIVAVPIVTETAETDEQIAARRKASAEAIAQFRHQFRQYNPTPSTDAIEPPADFPNDEAA